MKKEIEIEMYNSTIDVYIGKSSVAVDETIRRYGKRAKSVLKDFKDAHCFAAYVVLKDGSWAFVISIDKTATIEDIYHESLHMAFYNLLRVGIKTNVYNHEALCYLQGYIAKKSGK